MSLAGDQPTDLPADLSRRETIEFISPADGTRQTANIYFPLDSSSEPLPLVLAPHPSGWTAEEDYHGGLAGLRRKYHHGWHGLAVKYGVIIVIPHGHHRRMALNSLANPAQIADMNFLIDRLSEQIDHQRIYACGLSMGGQEALVLAGRHPNRFAAVVAFNPVVDLAAWYDDLADTTVEAIQQNRPDLMVVEEVGGRPVDVPHAYAERSPIAYVDALAQVPMLIYWTDQDVVVPRQVTHQSYLLYQTIKAQSVTNPIAEYNHTHSHGVTQFNVDTCWQMHEWCDYELALQWLLNHRRA